MTTARLIEYRITRQLLRRRELEARRTSVDTFIKGLSAAACVALAALILPEVLLPLFVLALLAALGL